MKTTTKLLIPIGGGGVRYVLRDLFTTDLAAGAVNNTAAEPGPGTRTVIDTENKFSIAGGLLVSAGGAAVSDYCDPGLYYDGGFARADLPTLYATVQAPNTRLAENLFLLGWSPANGKTAPGPTGNWWAFTAGEAKTRDAGGFSAALATHYAAGVMDIAITLKASGADYYIRNTNESAFSLLRQSTDEAGATMYPYILNYSGVFSVGQFGAARIIGSSQLLRLFPGITYHNVWCLGDSKTLGTGDNEFSDGYKNRMDTHALRWLQVPASVGQGGADSTWFKNNIAGLLVAATDTPEYVLINIGANDIEPGASTGEVDFKANYQTVLTAIHAKWSSARIYLARVWERGSDTEADALDGWIDAVIAANPTYCYTGIDERVTLKAGDNGTARMADDTHPNSAGYLATAQAWVAAMGF